jgi:hypothetical protein
MFNFFKKKEIKIYPTKASQSIASLALLINNGGYPFSDWKDPSVQLTEEEKNLIEPACQCLQLFFYRYAYNERHLLGDVMLGSVLAVVKDNNPHLAKLYEIGIDLFEETMLFLFTKSMNKKDLIDNLPSYFAVNWERNYNRDETSKEIRDETSEKLLQCLLYSRTTGDSVLQPMIDAIVDFDLDEIEQISFRKKRSLFEDVLYKRTYYPFLFRHMPIPNSNLLLESRQKEHNLALEFTSKKDVLENNFIESFKRDGLTYQSIRDSYLEFIKSIDEIRSDLVNIGGVDCNICLNDLEVSRQKMSDLYLELIANSLPDKLEAEKEFKLKLDGIYLSVLELFNPAEYINPDEMISFIFTMEDSYILRYSKAIKVDLIVEYFKTHNLIQGFDEEQKEFVNSKLKLFSVL